ncbi:hypothetical protein E2C01_082158 [Portunus trituberculatus]|uniref:Uncharacterized protein n=1 Tax=Portunus trituberculatus TaxID=210409 RepID=A0A5B7IRM5_PORTR|nr:hypothetical protein [Portunus trituberculatus]
MLPKGIRISESLIGGRDPDELKGSPSWEGCQEVAGRLSSWKGGEEGGGGWRPGSHHGLARH